MTQTEAGAAVLVSARLVDDAAVLDDLDLCACEGILASRIDFGFPVVRDSVIPRAEQNGMADLTRYHGGRVVSTELAMWNTTESAAQVLDRLRSFSRPSKRPRLVYRFEGTDEREMVLRASAQSTPIGAPNEETIVFQAQWLAALGIAESTAWTELDLVASSPSEAGRTYDLTFDRTYTAGGTPGDAIALNGGTTEAMPITRLYGEIVGPRIANDTTGKTLEFPGLTITAGNYLELNHRERTARLNGSSAVGDNRYSSLDFAESEWWGLEPGPNIIRFYPTSVGATGRAVLLFRDAWL